jgi:hypothetical protein
MVGRRRRDGADHLSAANQAANGDLGQHRLVGRAEPTRVAHADHTSPSERTGEDDHAVTRCVDAGAWVSGEVDPAVAG